MVNPRDEAGNTEEETANKIYLRDIFVETI